MKKLYEYARMRHIRRAWREMRRRAAGTGQDTWIGTRRREMREAFEASCRGVEPISTVDSFWMPPDGRRRACAKLPAPVDFRYSQNPSGVIRFVYSLRREAVLNDRMRGPALRHSKALYVDLDPITQIDLDGALILTAELDRIRSRMTSKPFVDDENWSPTVRAILHEFGFYKLVEARRVSHKVPIAKISEQLAAEGLAVVKFISGNKAEGAKAAGLRDALILEAPSVADSRMDFYDGLIEAFANAVEHAYDPEIPGDGLYQVGRWWAGGFVDVRHGYLYMAVYDQGVGIPATLPRRPFWKSILSGGLEKNDADVIAGGLEYGRTRTDQPGRGNGLWSMCQITNGFDEAEVRITSGRGEVTFRKGEALQLEMIPSRFPGTMVRWRVLLPSERPV